MNTSTNTNKSNGSSNTGKGLPKKTAAATGKPAGGTSGSKPKAGGTQQAAPPAADRKKKLPIARQFERKIDNVAKRWHNLVRKTGGWAPTLAAAMADVEEMIKEAAKQMKAVPDDFAAPKGSGSGGGKAIEVGTLICITDKARPKYEGVLEKDEYENLKVLVIHGNKIRVRTHGGDVSKGATVLALPRGHVRPQKAVTKPAAETEESEEG